MQRIQRKLTADQKRKLADIQIIAEKNPTYYANTLENSLKSIKLHPNVLIKDKALLRKYYSVTGKSDLVIKRMIVMNNLIEELERNELAELFGDEAYHISLPDVEEHLINKYTKNKKNFVLLVEHVILYTTKLPIYIPTLGYRDKTILRIWINSFWKKLQKKFQEKQRAKIKQRSYQRRFEMEYKPGGKEAKKLEQHFYRQQLNMFCEDLHDQNTLKDLQQLAKHLKLSRYSRLNKKQLCKKIAEELDFNLYFI